MILDAASNIVNKTTTFIQLLRIPNALNDNPTNEIPVRNLKFFELVLI